MSGGNFPASQLEPSQKVIQPARAGLALLIREVTHLFLDISISDARKALKALLLDPLEYLLFSKGILAM